MCVFTYSCISIFANLRVRSFAYWRICVFACSRVRTLVSVFVSSRIRVFAYSCIIIYNIHKFEFSYLRISVYARLQIVAFINSRNAFL